MGSIQLEGANFSDANLIGANLRGANLRCANLEKANMTTANMENANISYSLLHKAELRGTNLHNAKINNSDLSEATILKGNLTNAILSDSDLKLATLRDTNLSNGNLKNVNFRGADLTRANLRHATLTNANLIASRLIKTDFSNANISGAKLYGSSRDDWVINGIICKYVYWGFDGETRTPKDQNFEPGEFEKLYEELPTITYYFSEEFTPITTIIVDKVVQEISQKNPQFKLTLDSFHSRGRPHVTFTVLHKEYTEPARQQFERTFEERILRLEGQQNAIQEIIGHLVDRPQTEISQIGDTYIIKSDRDTAIATDHGNIDIDNNSEQSRQCD